MKFKKMEEICPNLDLSFPLKCVWQLEKLFGKWLPHGGGFNFTEAYKWCESFDNPAEEFKCKHVVRFAYRTFESGRYWKMGQAIHSFLSNLDKEDLQTFKKTFRNVDALLRLAKEHGLIEELRTEF